MREMKSNGAIKAWINIIRLVAAALDLIALAGGIMAIIRPTPYMLWNMHGYLVLLALLGNVVVAHFGGRYRLMDCCYLLLHTASMLLIPLMNTLAASDVQNRTSQSAFALILYQAIFLFGAVNAILQMKSHFSASGAMPLQSSGLKSAVRWILVAILGLWVVFGAFISYILLGKNTSNMIEVFVPAYSVFWGLLVLGAAVLICKLRWRNKGDALNVAALAAGIIICAISMVPLAAVPFTVRNADRAFRAAFGNAQLDGGAVSGQRGFKKTQFSLQDYFYGTRTNDYAVVEDVLYYEGTTGADANVKLRFDAYMPLAGSDSPSRKNPVMIRIHGGSWTMSDKGAMNYAATNKHFANLGYVVFDIQYGLNNENPSFASASVPDSVKGKFDIDDMVRHIGIFTSYLANHADEYGANLDSVFITGASAGGQLAVAAALGITSGKYADILDTRLNIRGLIPFYPANGLPSHVGIGGAPDLVDLVALVGEDSPPCLIFHGTYDGIVPPQIGSALKDAYDEKSGAPSALLWMDFSGHGSDIYTPGYYNQIFMYYMERFMQQFQ
jgi:acetyl esterase/lipase